MTITRYVSRGKQVDREYKVTSVEFKKFSADHKMKLYKTDSLNDYSTGCKLHAGCFGHMCVTPSGNKVVPQSITIRIGKMSSEYSKACHDAFLEGSDKYIQKLAKLNLTNKVIYVR